LRFFPQFDFLQLETTVAISDTIPKWALLFQFKIVKLNYEEIWRRLKVEDPHNGRGKRDEGNSQAQKTAAMIRRRRAWRWHSRILRLKEGEERCDFWERREDFAIEGRRREMLRFLRKPRERMGYELFQEQCWYGFKEIKIKWKLMYLGTVEYVVYVGVCTV
jgi:hypothetical protein